jgi:alpha-tubulin suppressor-like RCC1 family protein
MRLRHLAIAALSISAAIAADDESNLVLLDTVNPAIRDLAEVAGDVTTYDGLNDKNKVGVLYSEGLVNEVSGAIYMAPGFNLLKHPSSAWMREDFFNTATGSIFATNGAISLSGQGAAIAPIYQRLPTAPPTWTYANNYLGIGGSNVATIEDINYFKSQLLHPNLKTQIYKRFEFPTGLNREVRGDDPEYEKDRKTISNTANKLIVVVHGWNTDPDVDPFTKGTWPLLLESIHGQLNKRKVFAPGWDLYAYQWGQDSYTGGLGKMLGFSDAGPHASGGVGVGQENGTQAAEIGYQHGLVLGKLISDHCLNNDIDLDKVHFIAHSAGTWVARSASLYLKNEIERQRPASVLTQQITLLDPYMPQEGYDGWIDAPGLQGGEESVLGKTKVVEWPNAGVLMRCENILSHDDATFGTNERFWVGPGNGTGYRFACRKVGASTSGLTFGKSDWGGHGGPVNYFAYTVDPNQYLDDVGQHQKKTKETWTQETGVDKDPAGWDYSLLMQEFYAEMPIGMTSEGFSLIAEVIGAQQSPSRAFSSDAQSSPAPASTSPWKQILLDVDSVGWVRAMLLPVAGGAPELAGPVRPEPDGTFSITLENGSVLTGAFDTTVVPAAVSLAIDGVPFGQKTSTSQGSNTHAGVDAVVLPDGKVVISLVLQDGTAGVVARRDGENTGWEGAGTGTVDSQGNVNVNGEDGFQASGQLGGDGGLVVDSVTIVPPQVPEIHVTEADGAPLVSGIGSKDFGTVALGGVSASYAVTIRNTGTIPLTGLGLSLAGSHPGGFSTTGLSTATLLPNESLVVEVDFRPQAVGAYRATLQIASNDRDENPYVINLSGIGVTPQDEFVDGGGSLFSSGRNWYGELGDGTNENRNYFQKITDDVSAVEGGASFAMILKANGDLWTTGFNLDGRLGDGTTTNRSLPVYVTSNVGGIFSNGGHGLFIKNDHTLWGMGLNNQGQLGDGTETNRSVPVQIASGVLQASGGSSQSLFIKMDGTLWAVGGNDFGQLGDGTTIRRYNPVQIASGVSKVSAGGLHSLFIKQDGTLWAMGDNQVGQLGDGTTTQRNTPVQIATDVCGISAGTYHSMYVTKDGRLWVMGWNFYGQLGFGNLSFQLLPVPVASNVVQVSAARDFSLFIKSDGTLWGMGGNEYGELGDGTNTNRYSPIEIATGVVQASAGSGTYYLKILPKPEIAIEEVDGSTARNGDTRNLGVTAPGVPVEYSFTIKNSGSLDLTGLTITKYGTNAPDFTILSNPISSVIGSGGSTTITVRFRPSGNGVRTAALHIASNDGDENPFIINLAGTGLGDDHGNNLFSASPLAVNSSAVGTIETIGDVDYFSITLAGEGNLTIRSTGDFNVKGLLYNSSGELLGQSDDEGGAGQFRFNYPSVKEYEAGTYFLAVRHTSDTGVGSYGVSVSLTPGGGGYASWILSSFPGITDSETLAATSDPDRDGMNNAVEMIVGGNPASGNDGWRAPKAERVLNPGGSVPDGDYLVFTYRREDSSLAAGASCVVEYDNDLDGVWTSAEHDTDNVKITETADYFDLGVDRVQVYIPRSTHRAIFARLRVITP